jgi:hypothetical protein
MIRTVVAAAALLLSAAAVDAQNTFRCESDSNRYKECRVTDQGRVVLNRQLSDSPCVEGRTWGIRGNTVWVDSGCRGEFTVQSFGMGGGVGVGSGRTLLCESDRNRKNSCPADTMNGIQLRRRVSDSPCELGRDWGYDHTGVWVSNGCRAEFVIGTCGNFAGPARETRVTCESVNNRRQDCRVDTSLGVTLARQLSDATCVHGRTWGYDRSGIWVTEGCRAEFTLGGATMMPPVSERPTITCESKNNRREHCRADTRMGVSLRKQLSDAPCVRGRSWDYDRDGVWVTEGCRGEFVLDRVP